MMLHEIQKLFVNTMIDSPETVAQPSRALQSLFTAEDSLAARLAIYRNNIVGSLTDALLATYPLVTNLTGEEFATAMLRSYVLLYPPETASLSDYGDKVAAFIAGFTPASTLPYLPDIARMEWAMNQACYAPDDLPLTSASIDRLMASDLADARLPFRASVQLVKSPWPVLSIRAFCLQEAETEEKLDTNQPGESVLIYRPGLTVELIALSNADYHCLSLLKDQTLGVALLETQQEFPAFDIPDFIQRFITYEIFKEIP